MRLKKILILLLALTLLASCAACAWEKSGDDGSRKEEEETAEKNTSEETVPEEKAEQPVPKPDKVAVTIRRTNDTVTENGTDLLRADVEYASVDLSGFASEQKINEALAQSYDVLMDERGDYADSAREYADNTGDVTAIPFLIDRSINIARADEAVISLVYTDGAYTGGIHGSAWRYGENYSTDTGTLLHIADIATIREELETYAVKRLPEIAGESENKEAYFDGWEEVAAGLLRDGNWTLTDKGLTVFAGQYEMAPYASGILEFTIPYGELDGLLLDKFIPETGKSAAGEVKVGFESEFDLENADVDILEQNAEADGIFFVPEGEVKNFRIFTVEYDVDYNPHENRVLYSVNRFTAGDAVELKTYIPDVLADIGISYESGGKTVIRYLNQSGENGKLLLTEHR